MRTTAKTSRSLDVNIATLQEWTFMMLGIKNRIHLYAELHRSAFSSVWSVSIVLVSKLAWVAFNAQMFSED